MTASLAAAAPARHANVASILVTYDPELTALADALAAHARTGVGRLYVVDNGSREAGAIASLLAAQLAHGSFIQLDANLGLAAAQNVGIERALTAGATHVALFDQDSVPPAELLDVLLADEARLAARGMRVGAIGPACRDARSGRLYPQYRLEGLRLRRLETPTASSEPLEVSVLIASGSVIRAEVLREAGLMNAAFFIDCVDYEWCLRAADRGFRHFVSPAVVLQHAVGDDTRRALGRDVPVHSPLRAYYGSRNNLLLARLPWVPLGYKLRALLRALAPSLLWSVHFDPRYVAAVARGVQHGLQGRTGSKDCASGKREP